MIFRALRFLQYSRTEEFLSVISTRIKVFSGFEREDVDTAQSIVHTSKTTAFFEKVFTASKILKEHLLQLKEQ